MRSTFLSFRKKSEKSIDYFSFLVYNNQYLGLVGLFNAVRQIKIKRRIKSNLIGHYAIIYYRRRQKIPAAEF